MKRWALTTVAIVAVLAAPLGWAGPSTRVQSDDGRWRAEAAAVTIVRDDWGIAHVTGKTDADAVFGMVYAQAEDDFNRVETNFITSMGRLAEAEGEKALYQDLRQKMFIDPVTLKALYTRSSTRMKALMNAWADGLNFYLSSHPNVHPRVIQRFEPWMALSFSEGSIFGDIERVSLRGLEDFYAEKQASLLTQYVPEYLREPTGSNGMAIAPKNTVDQHALLLINPHTSFYFRSELQVTSGEGLNAYGAVTWGQFFVYQGFNDRVGWMHTTSGSVAVDEFAETIVHKGGKVYYRYGNQLRPVSVSTLVVPYRTAAGTLNSRSFTVYRTHHGPIVGESDGKWLAVSLMNEPIEALSQSFLRTKATDYASFMKVAELKANSSNNTIYADADGNIAYLHPQFIPRKDDRFDYTRPVDGANPATDWKGLHALKEAPHLLNPSVGWIFNTNNWPYSAAGPDSPKRSDYPRYMDSRGENERGVHATVLLTGKTGLTLDGLTALAYDSYLPAFAELLPLLIRTYDALPADDPQKGVLRDPIDVLRAWDYRWAADSVPTSLAVFWGENLMTHASEEQRKSKAYLDYIAAHMTPAQLLMALEEASDRLKKDFGSWRTPWGQISRFQRLDANIVQHFDDNAPSIPVPFTSNIWGSLATFAFHPEGPKRRYGTAGNTFVAVVEFGPRIRAKAVTPGGASGDSRSAHFNDQAERYASGRLRDVYFYPDQLAGHTERRYQPGDAVSAQTTAPAFSVIHAGTLLAVPGKPAVAKATVVVEGDKVKEIRAGFVAAAALGLPADTPVVDLSNAFVMPGFIDLHVHLSMGDLEGGELALREPDNYFTLVGLRSANATLMAGFTTVRDLGSQGYTILGLRDAIRDGIAPGPRILASGDPISPTNGHADNHAMREEVMEAILRRGVCNGADDCRLKVRLAIRRGVDVIKVMATGGALDEGDGGTGQMFTDEELKAIADTAHAFGRKVTAHAHAKVGIDACVRAGFDSIEHGMWADEATLKAMKAKGIWLVPTVATITFVGDTEEKVRAGPMKNLPPVSMEKVLKLVAQPRKLARMAHDVGVGVALGTDAPIVPHGKNAQEMVDYVGAGFTPMEALMTGTVNAAQAGGIKGVGRLEPGMSADIVAMAKSPLDDIHAVMDVSFVMSRGIVYKNGIAVR